MDGGGTVTGRVAASVPDDENIRPGDDILSHNAGLNCRVCGGGSHSPSGGRPGAGEGGAASRDPATLLRVGEDGSTPISSACAERRDDLFLQFDMGCDSPALVGYPKGCAFAATPRSGAPTPTGDRPDVGQPRVVRILDRRSVGRELLASGSFYLLSPESADAPKSEGRNRACAVLSSLDSARQGLPVGALAHISEPKPRVNFQELGREATGAPQRGWEKQSHRPQVGIPTHGVADPAPGGQVTTHNGGTQNGGDDPPMELVTSESFLLPDTEGSASGSDRFRVVGRRLRAPSDGPPSVGEGGPPVGNDSLRQWNCIVTNDTTPFLELVTTESYCVDVQDTPTWERPCGAFAQSPGAPKSPGVPGSCGDAAPRADDAGTPIAASATASAESPAYSRASGESAAGREASIGEAPRRPDSVGRSLKERFQSLVSQTPAKEKITLDVHSMRRVAPVDAESSQELDSARSNANKSSECGSSCVDRPLMAGKSGGEGTTEETRHHRSLSDPIDETDWTGPTQSAFDGKGLAFLGHQRRDDSAAGLPGGVWNDEIKHPRSMELSPKEYEPMTWPGNANLDRRLTTSENLNDRWQHAWPPLALDQSNNPLYDTPSGSLPLAAIHRKMLSLPCPQARSSVGSECGAIQVEGPKPMGRVRALLNRVLRCRCPIYSKGPPSTVGGEEEVTSCAAEEAADAECGSRASKAGYARRNKFIMSKILESRLE